MFFVYKLKSLDLAKKGSLRILIFYIEIEIVLNDDRFIFKLVFVLINYNWSNNGYMIRLGSTNLNFIDDVILSMNEI